MQINVCFGLNNAYSQHCACTLASILYNSNINDTYNIYLISDYISEQNKNNFQELKSIRDFKIHSFIIDTKEFENLKTNNNLGASTFFRFKMFDLLSDISKVLYLDCDIIVRKDIGNLYRTNVRRYYCAGVEDILNPILKPKFGISNSSLYINAGVMLVNLNYCRENNISEKIKDFLCSEWEIEWGDQDIINKIFENKIKGVDLKWNCMYPYNNHYKNKEYYGKMAKDPSIIHYITNIKPWLVNANPHMKMEYFKYLQMTPYYDDFISLYNIELNQEILKALNGLKEVVKKK